MIVHVTRGIAASALGTPFGASVWATGYAVLPALGVYKPIKGLTDALRRDRGFTR